ncbi:hypothetical protein ABVV53_12375 [Novosphingobium sp. RD2P27]|uniref:Uncharacterized protein n=1 Tax=Novosphingobium kalidii TaxID=3230299 RepID=A0ABV2D2Z5_9SPHN
MIESSLTEHIIAYYIAGPANDLNIATRWYPYGELVLIIEDKFSVATRKFGSNVRGKSKVAGTVFLERMIAKGAWETKANDFGGQMHQFQAPAYKAALQDWQQSEPIVAKARAEGPEFWDKTFAELVA